MSIRQQAKKGFLWSAVERFSTQGIQFLLTIIIARLLTPADYGLVAMLSIFMAIAQTFIDSGFTNALIQRKNRTEVDYATSFYFNIIIAFVVYLLFFCSAPYIADFYHQPALISVSRFYFLVLIIDAFSAIQTTRFTINLDFKHIAFPSIAGIMIGGTIGVYMAYTGYGVWALVGQALVTSVVRGSLLWILAKWHPVIAFSFHSFRTLFGYGSRLLFSNLLHTLYTNLYSLIIGKYFGALELGYFNRSQTLANFPVMNFTNIVQKVLFPIQCQYQNDEEKFTNLFVGYLRISTFLIFPLMIGLAVLAEPLIGILLGAKWLPIVPFLQIISLSMMWYPVMQTNVSILDAKGRSDYHMYSEIIKKILAVLILILSIRYGVLAVCMGLFIYSIIDMSVVIAFVRTISDIGYVKQIKIILSPLFLSVIMASAIFLLKSVVFTYELQLLLGTLSGILIYFLLAYKLNLKAFTILTAYIKKK